MKPIKRELIVPIRDRRRGRRILTLRNFGYFTLTAFVLFAAITIRSELRKPDSGEFGRLYGNEVKKVPDVTPRVLEANVGVQPVDDQISADPLLLNSAAREQYLGDTTLEPVAPLVPPSDASVRPNPSEVQIVGDSSGVAIVEKKRNRPVLEGGFMRNQ